MVSTKKNVLPLTSNHDKTTFIRMTSSLLTPQNYFVGFLAFHSPLKVGAKARICPYFPTPKTWAKSYFRSYL